MSSSSLLPLADAIDIVIAEEANNGAIAATIAIQRFIDPTVFVVTTPPPFVVAIVVIVAVVHLVDATVVTVAIDDVSGPTETVVEVVSTYVGSTITRIGEPDDYRHRMVVGTSLMTSLTQPFQSLSSSKRSTTSPPSSTSPLLPLHYSSLLVETRKSMPLLLFPWLLTNATFYRSLLLLQDLIFPL